MMNDRNDFRFHDGRHGGNAPHMNEIITEYQRLEQHSLDTVTSLAHLFCTSPLASPATQPRHRHLAGSPVLHVSSSISSNTASTPSPRGLTCSARLLQQHSLDTVTSRAHLFCTSPPASPATQPRHRHLAGSPVLHISAATHSLGAHTEHCVTAVRSRPTMAARPDTLPVVSQCTGRYAAQPCVARAPSRSTAACSEFAS
jgi:hypothetical protein